MRRKDAKAKNHRKYLILGSNLHDYPFQKNCRNSNETYSFFLHKSGKYVSLNIPFIRKYLIGCIILINCFLLLPIIIAIAGYTTLISGDLGDIPDISFTSWIIDLNNFFRKFFIALKYIIIIILTLLGVMTYSKFRGIYRYPTLRGQRPPVIFDERSSNIGNEILYEKIDYDNYSNDELSMKKLNKALSNLRRETIKMRNMKKSMAKSKKPLKKASIFMGSCYIILAIGILFNFIPRFLLLIIGPRDPKLILFLFNNTGIASSEFYHNISNINYATTDIEVFWCYILSFFSLFGFIQLIIAILLNVSKSPAIPKYTIIGIISYLILSLLCGFTTFMPIMITYIPNNVKVITMIIIFTIITVFLFIEMIIFIKKRRKFRNDKVKYKFE